MDEVHAINVAKSHYRDGYNNRDVDRVLSVFAHKAYPLVTKNRQLGGTLRLRSGQALKACPNTNHAR